MSTQPGARTRDIVVIGCSAGGVDALVRILEQLSPGLPAAVFIAQHLAPSENPCLVSILQRATQLPVAWAEQGARVQRAHIAIAPPDMHLLFSDHHMRLSRGPRENYARPSIDKLFRSAAAVYESRVIGVLLTGLLEDGVAGLKAIRDSGGFTIVQDPEDAEYPELPTNALLAIDPDRVLPVDAIGAVLHAVVGQRVAPVTVPPPILEEAKLDQEERAAAARLSRLGTQVTISCPSCNGPLWEIGGPGHRRFRCFLGHSVAARDLLRDSATQIESALWSAIRSLTDRATTLELLASDAAGNGGGEIAEAYAARAREARKQAELAQAFMVELTRPEP